MSLVDTSRYISYLLRHRPDATDLHMDEHGWVRVAELIAGVNRTRRLTMEMLEEMVRTDDKQRYSFSQDKTLIRANQGHSIKVDLEFPACDPPTILYHGTGKKFEASIDEQGLLRKTRLYVHLSADTETAIKVGRRHGEPLIYTVDAGRMAQDGYRFFLSVNGVWLTEHVPPCYLGKTNEEVGTP